MRTVTDRDKDALRKMTTRDIIRETVTFIAAFVMWAAVLKHSLTANIAYFDNYDNYASPEQGVANNMALADMWWRGEWALLGTK